MKFVSDYTVSYKGVFYPAGVSIDIDPADSEEMSKHGTVKSTEVKKRSKKESQSPDETSGGKNK